MVNDPPAYFEYFDRNTLNGNKRVRKVASGTLNVTTVVAIRYGIFPSARLLL